MHFTFTALDVLTVWLWPYALPLAIGSVGAAIWLALRTNRFAHVVLLALSSLGLMVAGVLQVPSWLEHGYVGTLPLGVKLCTLRLTVNALVLVGCLIESYRRPRIYF